MNIFQKFDQRDQDEFLEGHTNLGDPVDTEDHDHLQFARDMLKIEYKKKKVEDESGRPDISELDKPDLELNKLLAQNVKQEQKQLEVKMEEYTKGRINAFVDLIGTPVTMVYNSLIKPLMAASLVPPKPTSEYVDNALEMVSDFTDKVGLNKARDFVIFDYQTMASLIILTLNANMLMKIAASATGNKKYLHKFLTISSSVREFGKLFNNFTKSNKGYKVKTSNKRKREGGYKHLPSKGLNFTTNTSNNTSDPFKYFDFEASTPLSSTVAQFSVFNQVSTGTDYNNRIGTTIASYDLEIQLFLYLGATMSFDTVRVVYFIDNIGNGVLPDWTDVFTTLNVTSFTNVNNLSRFTIFADKTYNINENNPNITQREKFVFRDPINGQFPVWTGSAVTPNRGAIWIAALSTESVTGGLQSVLAYSSRIRFSDRSKNYK